MTGLTVSNHCLKIAEALYNWKKIVLSPLEYHFLKREIRFAFEYIKRLVIGERREELWNAWLDTLARVRERVLTYIQVDAAIREIQVMLNDPSRCESQKELDSQRLNELSDCVPPFNEVELEQMRIDGFILSDLYQQIDNVEQLTDECCEFGNDGNNKDYVQEILENLNDL